MRVYYQKMGNAVSYVDNIDDLMAQVMTDFLEDDTPENWESVEIDLLQTLARDESMDVGDFEVGVTNMHEEEFANLPEFVGW